MPLFTGNTMRMTGLSGIDVDGMVRQIMMAESHRLHTLQRDRQLAAWRQEDYRQNVHQPLREFQQRFFNLRGGEDIRMSATTQRRAVNITGANGDPLTGVNVTAGSGVPVGTRSVVVEQLAARHSFTGAARTTTDPDGMISPGSTRLDQIGGLSGLFDGNVAAAGTEWADGMVREFVVTPARTAGVEFDEDNPDHQAGIDNGTYFNREGYLYTREARVDEDGYPVTDDDGNQLYDYTRVTEEIPAVMGRETRLDVNGTQVVIRDNMTVNEFLTAVNSSGAGVQMGFSAITNTFSLQSAREGESGRLEMAAGTLDALGLTEAPLGADRSPDGGLDAVIRFTNQHGSETRVAQSSNNFTLETGLSINLTAQSVGETINIEITQDTSHTQQVITDFVDAYNVLVRELAELRNTARPTGAGGSVFDPLLPHEREGMSESEINRWETEARQGMMHRSQEIERTLSDMRRAMSEGIRVTDENGQERTLSFASLGITHQRISGEAMSLLEINDDPSRGPTLEGGLERFTGEDIGRLLTAVGNAVDQSLRNSQQRIENHAGSDHRADMMNRNSTLPSRLRGMDDRIAALEERLTRREQQLFSQFGRMEAAVMQANSQMEFLWQMMAQ